MALRIATPPIGEEKILAGDTSVLGKIGTVPASGTLYVRCPLPAGPGPATKAVDWRIKCNTVHTVTFYKARTNVLSGTITLTDATAVDDGDTFELNGLTFTAETTATDAILASRMWAHTSQAAGAAALSALLTNATYGVPGIGTITVTAPTTTDVLTLTSDTNTALHFNQDTSAANEIAWVDTTLASLIKDSNTTAAANVADNSTTAGTLYRQDADGWPEVYVGILNTAVGAATMTVGATIHQSV